MAETGRVPEWESELLVQQDAEQRRAAALRAGRAILDAYERGMLPIGPRYLADTLRIVLHAVDSDTGT